MTQPGCKFYSYKDIQDRIYNVDKINESCKTLEKLILDFPKNKHIKNAKKNIQDYGCLEAEE